MRVLKNVFVTANLLSVAKLRIPDLTRLELVYPL